MDESQKSENFELYSQTMNPHWADVLSRMMLDRTWREARGCTLIDDRGREYLDLTAGFGTAILGHRPEAVRRALSEHLLGPAGAISTFGWSSEGAKVAETLLRLADDDFGKVQFFSGGAEAVEAALKFAAIATGRTSFLSVNRGFHGLTGIATALAGKGFWRDGIATPLSFAETLPSLEPDIVRQRLQAGDVAAVLLEPIQATAGAIEHTPEQLAALSEACRAAGTLLIADEVASGIGRSGRWFAYHHWKQQFRPDMVVVSKALTAGLIPVSAVLCKEEIFAAVFGKRGRAKIHGATMAANPLSMICAAAVLREAERLDVCALATEAERVFRAALAELDPEDQLFEILGRGLMLGIVPKRIPPENNMQLWSGLRDRGVLIAPAGHSDDGYLIMPSLTISADEIRTAVGHLVEVAREAEHVPETTA